MKPTPILILALLFPAMLAAQRKVEAEIIVVKDKFSIGRTPSIHHFLGATDTINASSTHSEIPTAKAVWDLFGTGGGGGIDTVHTTARLTGIGTDSFPLDIAQQGATTGQVLKWDGSAWVPDDDAISVGGGSGHVIAEAGVAVASRDTLNFANTGGIAFDVSNTANMTNVVANIAQQGATLGQVLRWGGAAWVANGTNLYDVMTTSGTVGVENNQVLIDDLVAPISLNLPPCNSTNDQVSFEIMKSGTDAFAVTIDPAGSEQFSDGTTTKVIYSKGTAFVCTCRHNGTVGRWFFHNM
jgi:hypothetical protein